MTKPFLSLSRTWDRRIKRAGQLAGQYPFASEILTFYSKLAAFQQEFDFRLQSTLGSTTNGLGNGRLSPELNSRDLERLMPELRPFLAFLVLEGPAAMADFAARHEKNDFGEWAGLLKQFWRRTDRDDREPNETDAGSARLVPSQAGTTSSDGGLRRFIALAFLQPYVEYLAQGADMSQPGARRPLCIFCSSKPLVGVLRPEGDGAKRSLLCSFCFSEWDYLRIACPACGESREERMCVYQATQFEHIRVEACETCRTYLKTIDLTKNGLAIPEVDELAAIPLSIWADGQGYTKLSRNTFGS